MPPTVRSSASAGTAAATTSLTVTKPTGIVNGDWLYFHADKNAGGAFTWPSGFTEVVGKDSGFVAQHSGIARKKITDAANEPASYTISWTDSVNCSAGIVCVQDAHATEPQDATPTTADNAGSAGIVRCPAIVTVTADCLILRFAAPNSHESPSVVPGTQVWFQRATPNFTASSGLSRQEQAVAGDTGVADWTVSTNSGGRIGHTVALKGATAGTSHALAGVVAGASDMSGAVAVARALAGLVAGASSLSGAARADWALGGTVAGISSLQGSTAISRALAGLVAGQSTVAGNAAIARALAGLVDGQSSLSGALTLEGLIALAGLIAGESTIAGNAAVAKALAGLVAAEASFSGHLIKAVPLGGLVAGQSTVAGLLANLVALGGGIEGISVISGDLQGGMSVLVTMRHLAGAIVIDTVTGAVTVYNEAGVEVLRTETGAIDLGGFR